MALAGRRGAHRFCYVFLCRMATSELACTYAALILYDDGLEITADNINTILKAANVTVEPYWPSLFAKLFAKKSLGDLITNVGAGEPLSAPMQSHAQPFCSAGYAGSRLIRTASRSDAGAAAREVWSIGRAGVPCPDLRRVWCLFLCVRSCPRCCCPRRWCPSCWRRCTSCQEGGEEEGGVTRGGHGLLSVRLSSTASVSCSVAFFVLSSCNSDGTVIHYPCVARRSVGHRLADSASETVQRTAGVLFADAGQRAANTADDATHARAHGSCQLRSIAV